MIDQANELWNTWANDKHLLELYRKRCRQSVEEMTCAAQAATILSQKITPGETLLDAGCGGGYYYWSFKSRNIKIQYHGLDYTPQMIKLAQEEMCKATDLPQERFRLGSIENLNQEFDNIICFNVLTNNPHYALPLEKLLLATKKRILIRESMSDHLKIIYKPDPYIDEGKRHLCAYFNTYPLNEVIEFMESNNFKVTKIKDERTQDGMEMVVDTPHYWRILLGERRV